MNRSSPHPRCWQSSCLTQMKVGKAGDNITIIMDACVFFDLSNTYVWLLRFFTTVKHLVFDKVGKVNLRISAIMSSHSDNIFILHSAVC